MIQPLVNSSLLKRCLQHARNFDRRWRLSEEKKSVTVPVLMGPPDSG